MIDLGQYSTALERRERNAAEKPWPCQAERDARNAMLDLTNLNSDYESPAFRKARAHWLSLRNARLGR